MTLRYGYAKAKMTSAPSLKALQLQHEIQYHLHFSAEVDGGNWDFAVNVGTNDAGDLLKYKIVYGFHHPIKEVLQASPSGSKDLTGTNSIPALDFLRSDILHETSEWRQSDIIDGSEDAEPVAGLRKLLLDAFQNRNDIYVFGRFYREGNGAHDVHLNQGSRGRFIHRAGDDTNDHNDIWQDGALFVDLKDRGWAAYFAAFNQQLVPTDDLGNPTAGGHTI